MDKFERKYGKYAIKNLSLALILCYGFGYLIQIVNSGFLNWLSLNPYAILHGQIWRLFTWIIVPPDTSNLFFVAIMLFFYYSIGTALERTWGTWQYNVYIFSGMFFTVIGAFVFMALAYLFQGSIIGALGPSVYFPAMAKYFSTYYVNMSIFLAYAVTYPDMQVLFMFIIPLKVKYLGILYAVFMVVEVVQAGSVLRLPIAIAILASLFNFFLLWLRLHRSSLDPQQRRRRAQFRKAVQNRSAGNTAGSGRQGGEQTKQQTDRSTGHYHYPGGALHRCAVCGRTDITNPELDFRYCTKCEGDYEYCSDHLFTHIHVKKGDRSSFDAQGHVKNGAGVADEQNS
ncbi:MAG: hypothetical protein LKJ76_00655 [Lachnospiraceae bacterium]|jgi:hypothetical protein|nr:hypothetical protein [Lachnospiraceae bacterium]